ncbi:DUF6984 family protein [Sediminitomix flava]|uniref:DUF6984 domain-containing protein n=1 Tax=Sediminitomix flava TaxID=379075 RepID=A0A315ZC12_SEDFL|nr:hypothetical protein [Sediminitomix flava]PWJ42264.1 hypothetical protein BC781_103516 [Sediminitomix flava]
MITFAEIKIQSFQGIGNHTMSKRREIREEEMILVKHLLTLAGEDPEKYEISTSVDEYEGGKMGSINITDDKKAPYGGDFVQVNYIDSDDTPVVITLTKNTLGEVLDMDFWKKDFSKLLRYPKPEQVEINDKQGFI